MKPQFILTILAVFFILLTCFSCKQNVPAYKSNAIITGFDKRMCSCCGGLMINFTNDPVPYHSAFQLIFNYTATGISEKDSFPLNVYVEYETDTANACKPIRLTKFVRN